MIATTAIAIANAMTGARIMHNSQSKQKRLQEAQWRASRTS
jgi:hypothetical protein